MAVWARSSNISGPSTSFLVIHPRRRNLQKGHRAAAKQDDDAEEGKKKRGGIQIPEEWPWEDAKKLFESPDITPADEINVSLSLFCAVKNSNMRPSSSGKNQTLRDWLNFLSRRKDLCVSPPSPPLSTTLRFICTQGGPCAQVMRETYEGRQFKTTRTYRRLLHRQAERQHRFNVQGQG